MKYALLFLSLILSTQAFALDRFCTVEKSLVQFDSDTHQAKIRRAVSERFFVTTAEHEELKELALIDGDGVGWGTVQVSTGSFLDHRKFGFYATAIVTQGDDSIVAWMSLRMLDLPGGEASVSSLMVSEGDVPPVLELRCYVN